MFIHFLHGQLFKLYGLDARISPDRLGSVIRASLKWCALLSPDELWVPTTDLVESPFASLVASDLEVLADSNAAYFIGSTTDIYQLQDSKLAHYHGLGLHREWESTSPSGILARLAPSLATRDVNTTVDIAMRWRQSVAMLGSDSASKADFAVTQIRQAWELINLGRPLPSSFENDLWQIPTKLDGHAFLWDVVEDVGAVEAKLPRPAKRGMEMALGWNWALSYLEEYDTTFVGRIPLLGYVDCGVRSTHPALVLDLVRSQQLAQRIGLGAAISSLTMQDVVLLRENRDVSAMFSLIFSASRMDNRISDERVEAEAGILIDGTEAGRIAALGASNPIDAIIRAARSISTKQPRAVTEVDYTKLTVVSSRAGRVVTDQEVAVPLKVIVVAALAEELATVLGAFASFYGPYFPREDHETGRVSYFFQATTNRGQTAEILVSLVGRGQERAAAATASLTQALRPQIIANIGIAGSMSADLSLGDVVVGNQIVNYAANLKAVETAGGKYEIKTAGDSIHCDELLLHRAEQLMFIDPTASDESYSRLSHLRSSLGLSEVLGDSKVVVGPIACGPIVGSSESFARILKNWKRDLVALDMETSGVAAASEAVGMVSRTRFLALRGVSDLADSGKNSLEVSSSGRVRQFAVHAACEVLYRLVDSLPAVD